MDGVLADFTSGFSKVEPALLEIFKGEVDLIPNYFSLLDPMPGAIEAYHRLREKFDVYILSSASWNNPTASADKLLWVKHHLGDSVRKRLILSHNKHLNLGDYLIDDRTANGAGEFPGEHIHFGTEQYPNWESVLKYLDAWTRTG